MRITVNNLDRYVPEAEDIGYEELCKLAAKKPEWHPRVSWSIGATAEGSVLPGERAPLTSGASYSVSLT